MLKSPRDRLCSMFSIGHLCLPRTFPTSLHMSSIRLHLACLPLLPTWDLNVNLLLPIRSTKDTFGKRE